MHGTQPIRLPFLPQLMLEALLVHRVQAAFEPAEASRLVDDCGSKISSQSTARSPFLVLAIARGDPARQLVGFARRRGRGRPLPIAALVDDLVIERYRPAAWNLSDRRCGPRLRTQDLAAPQQVLAELLGFRFAAKPSTESLWPGTVFMLDIKNRSKATLNSG